MGWTGLQKCRAVKEFEPASLAPVSFAAVVFREAIKIAPKFPLPPSPDATATQQEQILKDQIGFPWLASPAVLLSAADSLKPAVMSGGVEIEQRPGLGNVLVATQAYTPGATVVQEKPLLHVPGLKPSSPLYQPLQVCMVVARHLAQTPGTVP